MSKLLHLIIFAQNILIIMSSNVTLYKSAPNSSNYMFKCVFHLVKTKQRVQQIDISKNGKVFYSVEYSVSDGVSNTQPGSHHVTRVTNFNDVSDIPEILMNSSRANPSLSEGWSSVNIKSNDKPITGRYLCKVYFLDGNRLSHIESDKIDIEDKMERVKLEINHGSSSMEKVINGTDIKMECKYKLLEKDKFAGLSLTKDKYEFFRFFHNKNHTFVKVPGIENIEWFHTAKEIAIKIKQAQYTTSGNYTCILNFTNPNEKGVISLSDTSHILLTNSTHNKLSKIWILLLLALICLIYK